jgi:anti-anti-sigma factor
MQVGVEHRDQAAFLHLQGEFDTFCCAPFLEKIQSLLDIGDRWVVLNLRKVKFINSTALGTIIKSSKLFTAEGGKLVISSPSEFSRKVLHSVGLQHVIPILDSDDDAVAFLRDKHQPETPTEGSKLLDKDETAVIFFAVDEEHSKKFLPEKEQQRGQLTNPVHGHSFGSRWRGVGRVSSLKEDGMTFTWDGGSTQFAGEKMLAFIAAGTEWKVKFRLPLLKNKLSEATIRVDGVAEQEGGIKVDATFSSIDAKVLEAVQQHVQDMSYIKKELKEATGGTDSQN